MNKVIQSLRLFRLLRLSRLIGLLSLFLLLSSCSLFETVNNYKPPKFVYKKHYLHDIDKKKVVVMVELEAKNTNPVSVHGLVIDYRMNVKGKRFAEGSDALIELQPKGITLLKIPVTIYFKDLERALGNVLKHILLDRREIETQIILDVAKEGYIETQAGWKVSIPNSYSKEIDQKIPLPKRSDVKKAIDKELKNIKDKLKKLF